MAARGIISKVLLQIIDLIPRTAMGACNNIIIININKRGDKILNPLLLLGRKAGSDNIRDFVMYFLALLISFEAEYGLVLTIILYAYLILKASIEI